MKAVGWRATFKAFGDSRTALGKTQEEVKRNIFRDNLNAPDGAYGWHYITDLELEEIYVKGGEDE